MKPVRPPVSFALLFVLAAGRVTSQDILEVQMDESGTWTTAVAGQAPQTIRARITAQEVSWCQLLLGAACAEDGVPTWVNGTASFDPITVTPLGASTWNGPPTQISVRASVYAVSFSAMMDGLLTPNSPNQNAVRDWAVPILDDGIAGLGPASRVWSSRPPIWLANATGTGLGPWNSLVWDAATVDALNDEILDPEHFRVEALFRQACIVQATAEGFGLQAANTFFDSEAYKLAGTTGKLSLTLQSIQAISAAPALEPGQNDATAPTLVSHPLPVASNSGSARVPLIHSIPIPNGSTTRGLDGVFTPGALHYFSAAGMAAPVQVRFGNASMGPGPITVVAQSDSTRTRPLRYKFTVPQNIGNGPVFLRAGHGGGWILAGYVQNIP